MQLASANVGGARHPLLAGRNGRGARGRAIGLDHYGAPGGDELDNSTEFARRAGLGQVGEQILYFCQGTEFEERGVRTVG